VEPRCSEADAVAIHDVSKPTRIIRGGAKEFLDVTLWCEKLNGEGICTGFDIILVTSPRRVDRSVFIDRYALEHILGIPQEVREFMRDGGATNPNILILAGSIDDDPARCTR
jgi:hypothetical protein